MLKQICESHKNPLLNIQENPSEIKKEIDIKFQHELLPLDYQKEQEILPISDQPFTKQPSRD